MSNICAIAECKNNSNMKGIIFHSFPIKEPDICKGWVNKCHRKDKFKPANSRICSAHFQESDYERDLKNELLGLPLRRKLKKGILPTIFSCRGSGTQDSAATRNSRYLRNKQIQQTKDTILDILTADTGTSNDPANDSCPETGVGTQATVLLCDVETETDIKGYQIQVLRQSLAEAESRNVKLKRRLMKLRSSEMGWKQKRRNFQKQSSLRTAQLNARNSRLQSVFSTQQLSKLNGKRPNWTTDDIVRALTVRSINLKACETTAAIWKIPLPGVSTLRSWMKGFTCQPGILSDVVDVMKTHSSTLSTISRLCVIMFDEMNVDSRVSCDPSLDKVVSHSKAQVVKVRGLCENWKQPVFFDFDFSMTKEMLLRIVTTMEEAGYNVCAIVSDLSGENRGLWKELGISQTKCSFRNAADSCTIHVFSDVPHNMKNIRNHLIDDGVFLEDGTLIDINILERLVSSDVNGLDLKLCPKLKPNLLLVSGAERMRVAPAMQLLSHHTATLAARTFPNQASISTFFSVLNSGFDVMNSRIRKDVKNPLRSGFGIDFEHQKRILNELADLVSKIRFRTKKKRNMKKALLPCQVGFIVSINSLFSLYEELKNSFGIRYILTSRLNQDALENLFSVIRSFSNLYVSPTPPEFRYRLRLILLGSRLRPPSGTNCTFDDSNMSYISSELMTKNKELVKYEDTLNSLQPKAVEPTVPEDSMILADINFDEVTENSLRYLAGYLAFKLQKLSVGRMTRKNTQTGIAVYGTPTGRTPFTENSSNNWLEMLSRGGLLIPSDQIYQWVRVCEKEFNVNFPIFQKKGNIVKNIVNKIKSKHSEMDADVVREFVATRIKIKMRKMNEDMSNAKRNKRKAKQFSNSSICKRIKIGD